MSIALLEPLRLAETYRFHAVIARQRPRSDPIFVLGHFRSGTTFLQELMAQDRQFAYLNLYEMVFFDVALTTEWLFKPVFARLARRFGSVYEVHRMPVDFDIPGEDDFAMLRMGVAEAAYWGGVFPGRYRAFFDPYLVLTDPDSPEARAWAGAYRYFVQKVSLMSGGRRLLLKSPPHTGRIAVLLRMFPDARFVYIHRNPYDVFASCKWLWDVNARYGLQGLAPDARESLILDVYERLIGAYLAHRRSIPPGRLIEIRYEDLVGDPVERISGIYSAFGLDGFANAASCLAELVARRRRATRPAHVLTAAEIGAIERRWAFALKEWPYPPPVSA